MRKIAAALLLSLALIAPALAQSPQLGAGQVLGNSTAAQRPARAESVTAILDRALGSTRGAILERSAAGWAVVGPSATAGLAWISAGTGADPAYGVLGLIGGGCNAALVASNGGILYSTASACSILAGTATARQMLQSGASAAPAWSTTVWPATTTINRLLYSSSASVIGEITTANSSILVTDSGGIPGWATTLPAYTLGGTVSGGGNQINNVIIGTTTPLAGSFTSLGYSTTLTGTSTNANCAAIGRQGATSPAFQVDCSTATQATGVKLTGAAAGGGVSLAAISSGSNENINIDAKGSGVINIGGTSTGVINLIRATFLGVPASLAGQLIFNSATSGNITINPPAGALGSAVWTLQAGTDTFVGKATADVLTNKSISGATNTFSNISTNTNILMATGLSCGTMVAATTYFTGLTGCRDTTEANWQTTVSFPFTLSNLRCATQTAPGGATTFIMTVRKNGADTTLTNTITGAATKGTPAGASVSFATDDLIDLKIVTLAGTATTNAINCMATAVTISP